MLAGDAAAARARPMQRIVVLPIGTGGTVAPETAAGRIDARLLRCMVLADALQSVQASAASAAADATSIAVVHTVRAPGKQIAVSGRAYPSQDTLSRAAAMTLVFLVNACRLHRRPAQTSSL